MPSGVFADCILTEYPYCVVCSGYDPTAPPVKKGNKTAKGFGRGRLAKQASIADKETITSALGMTEEELKYMQAINKSDGYRGKRKPAAQLAKK